MRKLIATLALAVALTCATHAAAEPSEAARELFRQGVALLQSSGGPRYAEAYEKFRAAYADSPSPKMLGNLGLCAFKLERNREAIDAYSRYLAEAPDISAAEREEIVTELGKLEGSTATVELSITPAKVHIRDERRNGDGSSVINDYSVEGGAIALALQAGSHVLIVSADGHESARVEIELAGRARESRSIQLEALSAPEVAPTVLPTTEPVAEEPSESSLTGFWIGLGTTGALAVATGVVGGLALAKHGDFEDARDRGDIQAALDLQGSGRKLTIATDVLLGATGVAAIVTTVLLVTSLSGDDDAGPTGGKNSVAAGMHAAPLVGPHSAGIQVRYHWR